MSATKGARGRDPAWQGPGVKPAALDEVCCGYRCTAATTETCCGRAYCADCYRDHRHDCDQLADEVRRDLYPDGCDHETAPGRVCLSCRHHVEDEIAARAERT